MPRNCAVEGCPYKKGVPVGRMVHSFPKNIILRKLWIQSTGLDVTDSSKLDHFGICSHHFHIRQYKVIPEPERRGQLYAHSVPSVNLPQFTLAGIDFCKV